MLKSNATWSNRMLDFHSKVIKPKDFGIFTEIYFIVYLFDWSRLERSDKKLMIFLRF